jgi:hypothetical protein
MEQFNNFSSKYNDMFNQQFGFIYTNQYVFGILLLCTILYLIVVKNQLPDYINKLLHNNFFMFAVISYTLYKVNNDIKTSVVLTFCFLAITSLVKSDKQENFCYDGITQDTNQNKHYCNLTDANKKTAQCDYCNNKE